MRRLLIGQILCLCLLLLLSACAVNENFVLDTQPIDVEIRNTPPQTGPGNTNIKRTEISLPMSAPASMGNVQNGLAAITGLSIEKGKINPRKKKILMYDLVSDKVLWSASGNYDVHGLYDDLLVLKKGSGQSYLALHPKSLRRAFEVIGEPHRYQGMEDLLIVSRQDSLICFNSSNGALKWRMKAAKTTWAKYHYVKDRKLIVFGDLLQVIDVDSKGQWNTPVDNTKVHTAEAMAINAGLCLLSACAGAATGSYYQTDYVEPRVTHSLGATPVFTGNSIIYADATTITMCDFEDGTKVWQHIFGPTIEPATVILSVRDNYLLTTFTGKRTTDLTVDTVADPQFKLLDVRSGDIIWEVTKSRADHPRDVIHAKDRNYMLYKTELRMYDSADTLMAASNTSIPWGDFLSFEHHPESNSLTVYCTMGILEADATNLQEITFTKMPAETIETYADKYPSYIATDTHEAAPGSFSRGKDGLKSINIEPGTTWIRFTSTFEGGY